MNNPERIGTPPEAKDGEGLVKHTFTETLIRQNNDEVLRRKKVREETRNDRIVLDYLREKFPHAHLPSEWRNALAESEFQMHLRNSKREYKMKVCLWGLLGIASIASIGLCWVPLAYLRWEMAARPGFDLVFVFLGMFFGGLWGMHWSIKKGKYWIERFLGHH